MKRKIKMSYGLTGEKIKDSFRNNQTKIILIKVDGGLKEIKAIYFELYDHKADILRIKT